ncbi:twin-arginine translocase TatA/TatE family subunit [Acinetobacter chinensis]|uniref:Sec-independent protein translocase protein TatA n=1 Tax=Acinetobacter chinensis TaxID=2004650 RepID=A0ABU3WDF1_9GAMM|nr:twin-arginine translocase TatA/TatE family subunit [Acinetobacter chinensis]MDV2468423.1 twin-arginine translocase TatA/TatE family subunit [Acinetobacter chinensis]
MFGLSLGHIALFALVLVLLFGTSKLKNLGKDLGGVLKDFKASIQDDSKDEVTHKPRSESNDHLS